MRRSTFIWCFVLSPGDGMEFGIPVGPRILSN
jgi:hypothetical protein